MSNIKINNSSETGKVATSNNITWLPIKKVAELRGISVQAIRKSCSEKDGRYVFRISAGKGGKQYEILLSSLPEPIRAKYWLEHHEPQRHDLPSIYKNQENVQIEHEAYEAIADSYSRKPAGIKEKAIRQVTILDEYLKLLKGGFKKGKALKIIQSNYEGVSRATLWRWLEQVENHPRQYWEVILAPDYQERARTEIHPRAWDFFYVNYGQQTQPDATVIYRETSKEAKKNGWGELPSLKTFLRRWDSDVPDNEKILLRKGKTALKESLPHLKRDSRHLESMNCGNLMGGKRMYFAYGRMERFHAPGLLLFAMLERACRLQLKCTQIPMRNWLLMR
jgi:hypothetical protein